MLCYYYIANYYIFQEKMEFLIITIIDSTKMTMYMFIISIIESRIQKRKCKKNLVTSRNMSKYVKLDDNLLKWKLKS